MWTEAHRARYDARLKEIVSLNAVAEVARWLEGVAPPRSGRATPYGAVVRAIAWHLRVGGPWRALPPGGPPWRTVYGWFRKWLEQGLFDRSPGHVARRRRRAMGRRAKPRLILIDTQSVKCIPVRGPRGYDAAKKVLGRKRVALVDGAARDRQLDNIEQALNRATDLIQDSQREIQRSRELMQDRRDQDRRDDLAEDARDR